MERRLRVGRILVEASRKSVSMFVVLFLAFLSSVVVALFLLSKLTQINTQLETLKLDLQKTKSELTSLENNIRKYKSQETTYVSLLGTGIPKEKISSLKTELIRFAKRNGAEIYFVEPGKEEGGFYSITVLIKGTEINVLRTLVDMRREIAYALESPVLAPGLFYGTMKFPVVSLKGENTSEHLNSQRGKR
jgi:cell division protein FtsB